MISQVSVQSNQSKKTVVYPSGDGTPVAETFDHLDALIATLKILQWYLQGQRATVLANQFLYYAENFPRLRVAPDVMVVFGVEPGGRDNFKTWEEGAAPAVVFEMTSKGTRKKDEIEKYALYERLEIAEYWQFDPDGEWIEEQLRGYRLVGDFYRRIDDGISQVLGLRLVVEGKLIGFYELETGKRLLPPDETHQQAEQAMQRAEQATQRAERLAQRLRDLGIDPDAI